MITVSDAVKKLEIIIFDEFKSSFLDKEYYPDVILNVHKYFKYQTRIYTFSATERIGQLYNDLRLGNISELKNPDGKDASYPLLFLTEVAQRLLSDMMYTGYDEEPNVVTTPTAILELLSTELSALMTMHGYEQVYVKDDYYQACIEPDEWTKIIIANPWLLVGILIRFTGYELTDNLYAHLAIGKEILTGGAT